MSSVLPFRCADRTENAAAVTVVQLPPFDDIKIVDIEPPLVMGVNVYGVMNWVESDSDDVVHLFVLHKQCKVTNEKFFSAQARLHRGAGTVRSDQDILHRPQGGILG